MRKKSKLKLPAQINQSVEGDKNIHSSLLSITQQVEKKISIGDRKEAIKIYRNWLQKSSPLAWAAHFNLGILLKEEGEFKEAEIEFRCAIKQNPIFLEAQHALNSLKEIGENPDFLNINLFTIAWSQENLKQADPDLKVLDNTENLRPDWREYWPIRNFLKNKSLNENEYYGFLSPKFFIKTGLTGSDVKTFINENPDSDVFLFSPQADMGAFFLNVFEQNEVFDPGFTSICQDLLDRLNYSTNINQLIMDSRNIIFSNFIVAKPTFWRCWLDLCENIFNISESSENDLSDRINFTTTYPGSVSRKVFIIERVASFLLATGKFKCTSYDTFKCAWSALPTSKFKDEAILSDALKIAYNTTKNYAFLGGYGNIRKKIFNQD